MSSPFIIIDEITDEINKLNTSLTTTINTINTNVNTINTNINTIKTNTAANSTESSTGTLSQKLAYLINRRDRIVTPSSTNIKTLSTSLSASSADAGECYNNSTLYFYSGSSSTVYIKQSGVYRFYFSGTLKQNNYFSNSSDSCGLVGYVYVYHIGDGNTTTHTVTIQPVSTGSTESSTLVSLSSATKTIDVPMQKGDRVYCKIALKITPYYYNICASYYTCNDWSASCTDCSIRGTVQELNGLIT